MSTVQKLVSLLYDSASHIEELKRRLNQQNRYRELLEELLAVIHRDGGHYTDLAGLEGSVADATEIIHKLRGHKDARDANAQYKISMAKQAADWLLLEIDQLKATIDNVNTGATLTAVLRSLDQAHSMFDSLMKELRKELVE